MARITPNSTIKLYSGIEIAPDNSESLIFTSTNERDSYFESHKVAEVTLAQMIKKTGIMKVNISGVNIERCNYLSFLNPSFDNLIHYCKIIDYDYENNELCTIMYDEDDWMTHFHEVIVRPSYIEREHLSEEDYLKAETNPYDPTIVEFRTAEDLTISKDIEKPLYSLGTDAAEDDGVFCGQTVGAAIGLTYREGILLVLSDFDWDSLDSQGTVSRKFLDLLIDLKNNQAYDCSFWQLSYRTFNYLSTKYSVQGFSNSFIGAAYNVQGIGAMQPARNNISPPLSYIYFDGASSRVGTSGYNFTDTAGYLNELLDWLTVNELKDSIVGIYNIPNTLMFFSTSAAGVISGNASPLNLTLPTAAYQTTVRNKKLCLFPFAYARLVSPANDVKELHYEDFKSAQDGEGTYQIAFTFDLLDMPTLVVAPIGYKMNGMSPNNPGVNLNMLEGIIYNQFPTMPYSLSGYLLQLGAQVNSIIGNNTIDYSYDIQQQSLNLKRDLTQNVLGNAISSGLRLATGDIGGAVTAGMDALYSGGQYSIDLNRARNSWKQSEDAYAVMAGDLSENNQVVANFQHCRPAWAANEYHGINGCGAINSNINNFNDIIILRVSLNPTILERYDQFFDIYGYQSGRCGIPRVFSFISGSADPTLIPHFATVNGRESTYIKTRDLKLVYTNLKASRYIKQMFDNGVRLVRPANE